MSSHLKRHSMPIAWPIKRKNIAHISKPNPGSHKLRYSTSVLILLRDVLGYVKDLKEARYAINHNEISINGRKVTNVKDVIGIFDIVEIKSTNEKFIVLLDELGKLKLVNSKDSSIILKVSGKAIISGKKFQLNFMNGFNLLVDEKTFKSIKVDDSIDYDFVKKKIISTLQFKEGSMVFIYDGKYKGKFGEVKGFINYNGLGRDIVSVQIGKDLHSTASEYSYVVGAKAEDLKRFN